MTDIVVRPHVCDEFLDLLLLIVRFINSSGEKLGRSANSVRDRVTKIGAEPKNKRKRKWTEKEKERFRVAFEQHGKDWQTVSK